MPNLIWSCISLTKNFFFTNDFFLAIARKTKKNLKRAKNGKPDWYYFHFSISSSGKYFAITHRSYRTNNSEFSILTNYIRSICTLLWVFAPDDIRFDWKGKSFYGAQCTQTQPRQLSCKWKRKVIYHDGKNARWDPSSYLVVPKRASISFKPSGSSGLKRKREKEKKPRRTKKNGVCVCIYITRTIPDHALHVVAFSLQENTSLRANSQVSG